MYTYRMLDPRPPRPMSPRQYRKSLREVHASLVAEGPVLITSRAGTVALVMAPPAQSSADTEPPTGTPPCPGRVERDG